MLNRMWGGINMNKMMGYCGLLCEGECTAYKATVDNSDQLRKSTAERFSKFLNAEIRPEQINCRGCRSEVRFVKCEVCEIRACNIEKQLDHCGECDSFPCGKVKNYVDKVPGLKERLGACRK